MTEFRLIRKITNSRPTLEGAGVHLQRVFGFGAENEFDPFLLLDDFRGDQPEDYLAGFPWHPHRGIETITYMLDGSVEHGDSMGNRGVINRGDVQWMTAGNGIIHQEMPQPGPDRRMGGFQLWTNLPSTHKMMDPRYRDIKNLQIPSISTPGGGTIRIISGQVEGVKGAVQDIVIDPLYLDIRLAKGETYQVPTQRGFTVLAYCFDGQVGFDPKGETWLTNRQLAYFGDGDEVFAIAGQTAARFLLLAGRPIHEPIAWRGPIVMNTHEELKLAFDEYNNGTFLSHRQT